MSTIIILNIVFAVVTVAGILALLGWGIVSNREMARSLTDRGRHFVVSPFERGRDRLRVRTAHGARPQRSRALDINA